MSDSKELRFVGDGVDSLILGNKKLVTLRSRPRGFTPMEEIDGNITVPENPDKITIPLTIVQEDEKALGEIFKGLLLLDGFLNVNSAIDTMRSIYTDRQFDESSLVASILFLTREMAGRFGKIDLHMISLAGNQEDAVRGGRMLTTVFPAYYYWLVKFHGIPEDQYPQELVNRGIINEQSAARSLDFYGKYKRARNQDNKDFYFWHYILTG